MNLLETKSYAILVLGERGNERIEYLLTPARLVLTLALGIFGSGALAIFLSLNGLISVRWTGSLLGDSVVMWTSVLLALASSLGLVFSKTLALKFIIRYRMNNWFAG